MRNWEKIKELWQLLEFRRMWVGKSKELVPESILDGCYQAKLDAHKVRRSAQTAAWCRDILFFQPLVKLMIHLLTNHANCVWDYLTNVPCVRREFRFRSCCGDDRSRHPAVKQLRTAVSVKKERRRQSVHFNTSTVGTVVALQLTKVLLEFSLIKRLCRKKTVVWTGIIEVYYFSRQRLL